ncbi:hypothetical protein CHS0354_012941 [Potamilus streckersoni]|uniref:Gamma-aminobutyric acid receptor alpha-like n=1 Tax=Potamilus streckersoni TaxID=2493646 RepID=A0AAE0VGA1_9BIVA|nr:hypothetical protein CHS0354_012941 [Potamilus streckersoni]
MSRLFSEQSSVITSLTEAAKFIAEENMSLILDQLLHGYDRRLRPGCGGPPLVVKTDILVRSMGPVSERDMVYSMDCYFRQMWLDDRLAFNASMQYVSLNIKMLDRVWYPDTMFLNGGKSYLHMVPVPNKFLRIYRNGTVLLSQRLTISAHCRMHLEKYPLDTQKCPLYLGSFAYAIEDVVYEWRFGSMNSVEISSDMRLSQFDLMSYPSYNGTDMFKGGLHSILVIHFYLRRHIGHFLINVYVPCCLLVVLSWVSFWINREATADRIELGTTTLLTMTFMGLDNRDDLPKVSYSTALDVYVAMCFVFVVATIIQFASVHYFTKYGYGEMQYILPVYPQNAILGSTDECTEVDVTQKEKDHVGQSEHETESRNGIVSNRHFRRAVQSNSALFRCWSCFFGTRNVNSYTMNDPLPFGMNSVSRIDKLSRALFPAVFLTLNVIYWSIYLTESVEML